MNIEELINTIKRRPGMFIGDPKLDSISTFISGIFLWEYRYQKTHLEYTNK